MMIFAIDEVTIFSGEHSIPTLEMPWTDTCTTVDEFDPEEKDIRNDSLRSRPTGARKLKGIAPNESTKKETEPEKKPEESEKSDGKAIESFLEDIKSAAEGQSLTNGFIYEPTSGLMLHLVLLDRYKRPLKIPKMGKLVLKTPISNAAERTESSSGTWQFKKNYDLETSTRVSTADTYFLVEE